VSNGISVHTGKEKWSIKKVKERGEEKRSTEKVKRSHLSFESEFQL